MSYGWHATLTASREAIATLRSESDYACSKLNEYGASEESEGSWYEVDEDIRDLSEQYPGESIVLLGEGEDPGDIWKTYARNGDVERIAAKIVHPEPPVWFAKPEGKKT